MAHFTETVKG